MLLAIVVGSGIMGERLSSGNIAIALLANSLATGAGLTVLIVVFGPLSGAHFNPAVTLVSWLKGETCGRAAAAFVASQCAGGIVGVLAAHLMFALAFPLISAKLRMGAAQTFSEGVATFGLIIAILGSQHFRPAATPAAVGLYVTAAYWFTASTSFANPAVTVARSLSDTFAGIAPSSVPAFVLAQLAGAAMAAALGGWLFEAPKSD